MQIPADDDPQAELLVYGTLLPDQAGRTSVEVRRGMAVFTCEGQEAGTVAAVVVDKTDRSVTHILLSRVIHRPEYRLVPLDLVAQVSDETVRLHIFNPVVSSLATWHGS